jgi:hypothetical protein
VVPLLSDLRLQLAKSMGVQASEVAAAVTRDEADRAWERWPRVRVTGGREALQRLLAADG